VIEPRLPAGIELEHIVYLDLNGSQALITYGQSLKNLFAAHRDGPRSNRPNSTDLVGATMTSDDYRFPTHTNI